MDNNPIVYDNGAFFLFGGIAHGAESVIAMLDVSTKKWSQAGTLNQGRWGHGVVVRSNDFVIVGGCGYYCGSMTTERCEMQNDQMVCATVKPKLSGFSRYAETMLVDENFCVNN